MKINEKYIIDSIATNPEFLNDRSRLCIGTKVVACKDGSNIMRYYTSIFHELFYMGENEHIYSISDLGKINGFINRSSWDLDEYSTYVDNNLNVVDAVEAYEMPTINGVYLCNYYSLKTVLDRDLTTARKSDLISLLTSINKLALREAYKEYLNTYNLKLNNSYIQTGDVDYVKSLRIVDTKYTR